MKMDPPSTRLELEFNFVKKIKHAKVLISHENYSEADTEFNKQQK